MIDKRIPGGARSVVADALFADATKRVPPVRINTHASGVNTHASGANTHASGVNTYAPKGESIELPPRLIDLLGQLKKREPSPEKLTTAICELCRVKPMTKAELAKHLSRKENYIMKNFLVPMVAGKKLRHLYPEMIRHPHQAYITIR